MPTVASSNYDLHHFDVRGSSSRSFFLDADELCCNSASFLGLDNLVTSSLLSGSAQPRHFGKILSEGDGGESDCLLLGSHSDDDLSPGRSHHGNAAMQFLLLDDDEAMCNHPMANAPDAACKLEAPAACMPAATSAHPLIRQHSAQQDASAPYTDSSTMYCLAVVDEATGLPLRPATPEETWEVERCFVLQQQSELLDAGLPLEQQCCRAGSASVSEAKDEDSVVLVPEQEQGMVELPEPEQQEEEKEEEEEEEEEEAAPVRTNKRPELQQKRCGPCDNCGATESPQWRQGPASKPLLCNACGMRFRRTNQLIAGETGTASGARGGARVHKKAAAPAVPAAVVAAAAPPAPRLKVKMVAPPPVPQLPDAKRPRRAAAVAAAATVAAAIDACS